MNISQVCMQNYDSKNFNECQDLKKCILSGAAGEF